MTGLLNAPASSLSTPRADGEAGALSSLVTFAEAYAERYPTFEQAFKETYGTRHRKQTDGRATPSKARAAANRGGV